MTEASANVAGAVSVQIGGNLAPFQAVLAQAEAMATAFDAKVSAILGSAGGGSSAFTATTAAANDASAAIAQVTAPAAAASAAIDKIAATSTAAATGIDAAAASMDTGGINAKALAAALALTGNNLEKATALMVANADAAKAQAAATETVTAATVALASAQAESGVVGSAGTLVQTTSAAKALDAELGNTAKLSASASAEILRIGNDAARGNFGRLTSAAVVLSTRLGEGGAEALTFRNVLSTFGGLAEVALNPIFLAIVGIPLALDLAAKGFEALAGSGKSAAEVLKENDQWIKSIASSFPDATAAAKSYADAVSKIPTVVAQDQAKSQTDALQAKLNSSLHDIGDYFDLFQLAQQKAPNTLAGGGADVLSALKAFENGGTLTDLQKTLANLHLSSTLAPDIKSMVGALQDSVKGALDLQHSIDGDGVAADHLTEAYQQLAIAANERKVELAATDNITKALQFQISTLGESNAAVAAAKEYQEVWNKGIEAGRTDLQELASQAASAAGQVASLTDTLTEAQAHSDLQFSISMIGLNPIQRQVAGQLGGANAAANLNTPTGQDLTANDELAKFQQLTAAGVKPQVQAKQLLDDLGKSGKLTGDQIATLTKQYDGWIAATAHKTAGGGLPKLDPFQQAMQSAKDDTANLAAQQQALGLTAEQADKLTESQKLLNEATKKGNDLSPAQIAAIDAASTAYAKQKAQLTALTELYNTGQQSTQDFFSTLKSDLQSGTSLWGSLGDAASKALDDIANKALSMAADGIWNMIFGSLTGSGSSSSSSGGIGSLLGSIFHFASGTNSAPGGLSLIGENGPELMNVPRGAQIIPAPQTRGLLAANSNVANSNGISFQIGTIDARGAQAGVGAEIANALNGFAKNQLPNLVRQYNANPNRRGFVPYPTGG